MAELFEKSVINGIQLNNRLVRSATNETMADEAGFPTEKIFKLYERLARGGVGLIITGHTFISQDGRYKAMLGIDTDRHIPRYQDLVKHVHKHGAKIAMQLNHCGRQTTHSMTGMQPIAPSAVIDRSIFVKPREMTEDDIERIIDSFVAAGQRVKASGFDAVQLHGAHGYLLSQFLCPHTNRRQDKWGGSLANRLRIILRIYEQMRARLGGDYPILIKLSVYDYMKHGLKLEEGVEIAKQCAEMGFDGIEVSCGIGEDGGSTLRGDLPLDVILNEWEMYRNKNFLFRTIMRKFGHKLNRPIPFTQGFNRDAAKMIKQVTKVPVFAVGGMVDPTFMENTIKNGDADYIALSRALITDPGFPKKLIEGSREPSRCIHCNLCLFYMTTRSLRCYRGKRMPS